VQSADDARSTFNHADLKSAIMAMTVSIGGFPLNGSNGDANRETGAPTNHPPALTDQLNAGQNNPARDPTTPPPTRGEPADEAGAEVDAGRTIGQPRRSNRRATMQTATNPLRFHLNQCMCELWVGTCRG